MKTLSRWALGALLAHSASASANLSSLTVGTEGNEPLIAAAPDGTLYITALQHLYRSLDDGVTWTKLLGPDILATALATDSSISIDPNGRVFLSFDYPYAGSTAVCTSDNKGDSWACNPAVVPGGTDRMWVTSPGTNEAYVVTNEGLYQTAFLVSTDGGETWTPTQFGDGQLSPGTGPLLQKHGGGDVFQAVELYDPNDEVGHLAVYVFKPAVPATVLSDVRMTPLPYLNALPSGAFDASNNFYLVSEVANASGGYGAVVARSADEGRTWTQLPALPGGETGTVTFAWLAAGRTGHVGVIYYYTPVSGDPTSIDANAPWAVMWAESFDADAEDPHWTVMKIEDIPHRGVICAAAGCTADDDRFAGDFINVSFDADDRPLLTWMSQTASQSGAIVRFASAPVGLPTSGNPGTGTVSASGGSGSTSAGGGIGLASLLALLSASVSRRRRHRPQNP